MEKIAKKLFCCLNSRKSKHLDYILLLMNSLCFIPYIIFFSTMSREYINEAYLSLSYLNFCFLFFSVIINVIFICMRKKNIINFQMNFIALFLTVFIILISFSALILNCIISINILSELKSLRLQKKNILNNSSKEKNKLVRISIISADIMWWFILFLWLAIFVRIKYKTDNTYYNYLKMKSFRKNFYLFNDETSKESKLQLRKIDNADTNKNKIIKTIKNIKNELVKFNAKEQLIDEIHNQSNSIIIENNLNISNTSNTNNSKNSSLSDSFQKPVNMIIIGTDDRGCPIYGHQNSFDKGRKSNDDSDSFSNHEQKFDQSNYIKFNDMSLKIEDNLDIENNNLEKNLILEKENEPKVMEKKSEKDIENENENDNDNDNNNEYKDHFMPLTSVENDKELENKDNDEQISEINK